MAASKRGTESEKVRWLLYMKFLRSLIDQFLFPNTPRPLLNTNKIILIGKVVTSHVSGFATNKADFVKSTGLHSCPRISWWCSGQFDCELFQSWSKLQCNYLLPAALSQDTVKC